MSSRDVEDKSSPSGRENIDCMNGCGTELIAHSPRQEGDTTTRAKMEAGNYYCDTCTTEIREKRKQARQERKAAKKLKRDNIKLLAETKVQIFDRLWRDVDMNGEPMHTVNDKGIEIVNLPEHERLMWIYIRNNIRKSELGFKADEEDKVICRVTIQNIFQRTMTLKQEISNSLANEEITKQIANERTAEVDAWKKSQLRKQSAYVDRQHTKANKEWESRPEVNWERMVKEPGHRDPEGNKALRYHLLSEEQVFRKRQELRRRQIKNIEHTDLIEKQITDQNQKRLFEGESQGLTV